MDVNTRYCSVVVSLPGVDIQFCRNSFDKSINYRSITSLRLCFDFLVFLVPYRGTWLGFTVSAQLHLHVLSSVPLLSSRHSKGRETNDSVVAVISPHTNHTNYTATTVARGWPRHATFAQHGPSAGLGLHTPWKSSLTLLPTLSLKHGPPAHPCCLWGLSPYLRAVTSVWRVTEVGQVKRSSRTATQATQITKEA